MARPERVVDPENGPVHEFAAELRVIRNEAGNPTYLRMARASGRSRTALAEAAGGDHLPSWETVEAFVRACGQEPVHWRRRWEQTRQQMLAERSATLPASQPSIPQPVVEQPSAEVEQQDLQDPIVNLVAVADRTPVTPGAGLARSKPLFRGLLPLVMTALVSSGLTAALTLALRGPGQSDARGSDPAAIAVAIQVQNKVAIGPTALIEDATPAYLSTRTIPFCSRQGCEVAGTSMWSGVWIAATCQIQGTSMTNEDLASPGISGNAGGVISTLWYWATLPQGLSGFISEVYVVPQDRGGLGLPPCHSTFATS